mmetsp:Transcript_10757/g.20126  ORF Transcript_10757/g.20126 Transcript_10757/m.20126 type:complete len:244 (-) Transcript_10757:1161-1892(-)
MRKNYETILCGEKVVLVPYRPEHVEKYHQWMKCPFLLEMTGSEPLSYEEEVQMQKTWRDNENICTFILLSKELCSTFLTAEDTSDSNPSMGARFIPKSLNAMIGDVNLFLSSDDDDDDAESDDRHCCEMVDCRYKQAELDIMVAEESFRGKGIGKEAVLIMMLYGAEELGVRKFIVKIKKNNSRSILLFKSLEFEESNYAACFEEYEYVFQRHTAADAAATIRVKFKSVKQTTLWIKSQEEFT